jgi:lysophospholipid hydrolase
MAFSETASSGLQTSSGLPYNTSTASLLAAAISTPPAQMDAQTSRSWIGMLAYTGLLLLKVVPGILYWLITFTTITLPTFLFGLFSISLTFTMNATTL